MLLHEIFMILCIPLLYHAALDDNARSLVSTSAVHDDLVQEARIGVGIGNCRWSWTTAAVTVSCVSVRIFSLDSKKSLGNRNYHQLAFFIE
jgi:hypothetical protein